MRHLIATWLHHAADTLDHTHTVHTAVHDHDGLRTITVNDYSNHNRLRATYQP